MRHHAGRSYHSVLVVDSEDSVDRVLVPALRRQATAARPVLMVVREETEQALRERLGMDAGRLEWRRPEEVYQQDRFPQLGLALNNFVQYVRRRADRLGPVEVFAESCLPGDRLAAYLPYEAVCNELFPRYGSPVTCIYDRRWQPDLLVDEMRKVHSGVWTEHGCGSNPEYVAPLAYLDEQAQLRTTIAAPQLDTTVWELAEVAMCRGKTTRWVAPRLPEAQTRKVIAAISEVVTNGLLHGRPPVRLRAWWQGETLTVQIDDCGGRRIPVDAGYRPPESAAGAMGLWIARQAADVLVTDTGPGRTSVQLQFSCG